LGVLTLFTAFFLCLTPFHAGAQAVRSTIITNGPAANRINLVVLSEGYQTNQLGKFLIDATNEVNNLLSTPPYQEYRSYFNAFAISIASVDSGSDHPSAGVFKNTYFNSSYDTFGLSELLTIPPNDRDANYNNGEGKVINLLTNLVPEYDLVMLLVNDLQYGGSGGSILISSLHVDSAEIVRHESGHAFAGLADEYGDPFPGSVPVEKPNATAQTNRTLVKWNAWILPTTPLPTPEDPTNAQVVGLFEGAEYQFTGWYRPRLDCKMRTLGVPFCEICSEAFVKSFYSDIRPIDTFSPVSTNLNVTGAQPISFSITPLQPTTHDLYIQWYTNNVASNGETNTNFQLPANSLGTGTHTVRAVVYDPTALVRTDPANLLRATNTWSVTVNAASTLLSLIEPLWLTNNRFRLTVTGSAPQGFVIQASSNLINWVALSTNTLTGNRFDYTNFSQTNMVKRFYRAYTPP
jgi:hypothetical protein